METIHYCGPCITDHAAGGPRIADHAAGGPRIADNAAGGPRTADHAAGGPRTAGHAAGGPCIADHAAGAALPGDLVSLGMIQRIKWGDVAQRVVIRLFSCSWDRRPRRQCGVRAKRRGT